MTNQIARLYALVVGVVVFFVAWAAIAAHPWQTTKPRPSIRASPRSPPAQQRAAAAVGCRSSRSSTGAGPPTGSRSPSRKPRSPG